MKRTEAMPRPWVIGEAEVIIGAEIQDLVPGTVPDDLDMPILRGNDRTLGLPQRLRTDLFKFSGDVSEYGHAELLGKPMSRSDETIKLSSIRNGTGYILLQIAQCSYVL
jgi:hypothetical protein